jgi:Hom_end-associated Hint
MELSKKDKFALPLNSHPHKRMELDPTKTEDKNDVLFYRNISLNLSLSSDNSMCNFQKENTSSYHGKGTFILMFSGVIKKVEDIKVGDCVMGLDSTSCVVTQTYLGFGKLYNVIQSCGTTYTVGEDHILLLKKSSVNTSKSITESIAESASLPQNKFINISVKNYLNMTKKIKKMYYGYRNVVEDNKGEDNVVLTNEEHNSVYNDGKSTIGLSYVPNSILFSDIYKRKLWLVGVLEQYGILERCGDYKVISVYLIDPSLLNNHPFVQFIRSIGLFCKLKNEDEPLRVFGNNLYYLPWKNQLWKTQINEIKNSILR